MQKIHKHLDKRALAYYNGKELKNDTEWDKRPSRSFSERGIGTQFDPVFAKIMLEMIEEDTNYELHEM